MILDTKDPRYQISQILEVLNTIYLSYQRSQILDPRSQRFQLLEILYTRDPRYQRSQILEILDTIYPSCQILYTRDPRYQRSQILEMLDIRDPRCQRWVSHDLVYPWLESIIHPLLYVSTRVSCLVFPLVSLIVFNQLSRSDYFSSRTEVHDTSIPRYLGICHYIILNTPYGVLEYLYYFKFILFYWSIGVFILF